MSTNKPVVRQNAVAAPRTDLPDWWMLGDVLARSGYFKDAADAAKAAVKVLAGRELGIGPVAAMVGIDIIEGQPSYSANLLAALIKSKRPAYDYRVVEHTHEMCAIRFFQDGKEIGVSTFTLDDAKTAGLLRPGSNWTKYPRNMLFARAMTNGQAWFCPDVTHGVRVYDPEELGRETGEVFEMPGGSQAPAQPALASSPGGAPPVPGIEEWKRLFRGNAIEPEPDNIDRVKAVMKAHGIDTDAKDSLTRLTDIRLWTAVRDDVCRQFHRPLHHGLQHEASGDAFIHYDVPARKDDAVRHVVLSALSRHECDCAHGTKGRRGSDCHHINRALELLAQDVARFADVHALFAVLVGLNEPPSEEEAAAGLKELAGETFEDSNAAADRAWEASGKDGDG
jgi:hypothetical protein